MNEKLIILPDSDFIKKFTENLQKENSYPDILYVDGHIDLPFYMVTNAPDRMFDDLDSGPVTPDTIKKSGVRLFNTAIYCQDVYNGENAQIHFQNNFDYTDRILGNLINVRSANDIQEIKNSRDAIGTVFLLKTQMC